MFEKIEMLRMARAMGQHTQARHIEVARNIANADTPGFRAHDLQPFAETYRQAEDGGTLWFMTRATSDVAADAPQRPVNVAVQDKDFWASLAGHGQLVRDDARKKEFWNPATEAFFGEGSSPRDRQKSRMPSSA